MNFTNIDISKKLKDIGFKTDNQFFYIKNHSNEYYLSFKNNDGYIILNTGKIVKTPTDIISCYNDTDKLSWVINCSIFKIYFLDPNKYKFIDEFKEFYNNI